MTGFAFTPELLQAAARWAVHRRDGAHKRWELDRLTGANDLVLRNHCRYEMELHHGESFYHTPWDVYLSCTGGAEPEVHIEDVHSRETYTLRGEELFDTVREALEIKYPVERAQGPVQDSLF